MQKNLRLDDDLAQRLAETARATGQSQSRIVAAALDAYFSAPAEDWRRQIEQRLARLEEAANL